MPADKKYSLHPRNRFRNGYDFPALCKSCPELANYFTVNHRGESTLDFAHPLAVKLLNRTLLEEAYGVREWEIPPGFLCPPVPGRADYLHTLADLLSSALSPPIRILDIGVGANCIFPIIGAYEFGWNFVGTEMNREALESAQKIVAANSLLLEKVELRLQPDPQNIFTGMIQDTDFFAATICNPPFHSSAEAVAEINRKKWRNFGLAAVASFGGQSNEMWCEGGEAFFISRMIEESESFQKKVGWFTSYVSQEAHLPLLQQKLRTLGVVDLKVLEMGQGQKRSRFLAWSWQKDCTLSSHEESIEKRIPAR
jgi:23S rRNA (adenine1618-N6)-methyltransferase